jgi:hypothetical protein
LPRTSPMNMGMPVSSKLSSNSCLPSGTRPTRKLAHCHTVYACAAGAMHAHTLPFVLFVWFHFCAQKTAPLCCRTPHAFPRSGPGFCSNFRPRKGDRNKVKKTPRTQAFFRRRPRLGPQVVNIKAVPDSHLTVLERPATPPAHTPHAYSATASRRDWGRADKLAAPAARAMPIVVHISSGRRVSTFFVHGQSPLRG